MQFFKVVYGRVSGASQATLTWKKAQLCLLEREITDLKKTKVYTLHR